MAFPPLFTPLCSCPSWLLLHPYEKKCTRGKTLCKPHTFCWDELRLKFSKMIWMMMKRLKWSAITRSKFSISIMSFLVGYLFHFLISLSHSAVKDVFHRHYSSHVGRYNVDVLLVVLVFSSVNNFSRRQSLRDTWLSGIATSQEVKYYFVISLGKAKEDQKTLINVEQDKYNDLLIFNNLEDSFYLLTSKLVASFGWLTDLPVLDDEGKTDTLKLFNNFKFVLKTDDDSFVRVTELANELRTVFSGEKGKNLYWGFFDGRAKIKKIDKKYKEDQWDICDHYIPYALGGGYVLAHPMVEYIAKNEKFLKKYRNEDVSVGAWLSSYVGLKKVHDPRFDTEYKSRGCHQSYLITHKHSENAMRNFYKNLRDTGRLCQKEFQTRLSYNYNWEVIPSKCCSRVNRNIP